MKTTVVTLIDDLDGESTADETVKFALDGTNYEIDLSKKNAEKLRGAVKAYVEHGRRVTSGSKRGRGSAAQFDGVDTKAVRAWAASNKIELNTRGRIPTSIIERYRAAGN